MSFQQSVAREEIVGVSLFIFKNYSISKHGGSSWLCDRHFFGEVIYQFGAVHHRTVLIPLSDQRRDSVFLHDQAFPSVRGNNSSNKMPHRAM